MSSLRIACWPESGVRGILERAHHAGDVAQRGPFHFAVAQRTRRFSFEIKNDEIFAGINQLPQMMSP